MAFLSNQFEQLKKGNFRYFGNWSALLGGVIAMIGVIISFATIVGIPWGIIGLILVFITLMVEFPLFKTMCPVNDSCTKFADFLKKNAMRAVWYILSGIIFFVMPGGGITFTLAGIFDILAGIFYGIAQLRGQTGAIGSNGSGGIV